MLNHSGDLIRVDFKDRNTLRRIKDAFKMVVTPLDSGRDLLRAPRCSLYLNFCRRERRPTVLEDERDDKYRDRASVDRQRFHIAYQHYGALVRKIQLSTPVQLPGQS